MKTATEAKKIEKHNCFIVAAHRSGYTVQRYIDRMYSPDDSWAFSTKSEALAFLRRHISGEDS